MVDAERFELSERYNGQKEKNTGLAVVCDLSSTMFLSFLLVGCHI